MTLLLIKSKLRLGWLCFVHLLLWSIFILSTYNIYLKLGACIVLLLTFIYYQYLQRRIKRIELLQGDDWRLFNASDKVIVGRLSGYYLSPVVLVLVFRLINRRLAYRVPIFVDMLSRDDWRQLRRRLILS